MNQTLTLAEIEARFDAEWVLVGDPELDSNSSLVRGTVIFHSKSRDEVEQRDSELHLPVAAIIFTGQIPDNAAVVL